jgi:hypothetical protein
LSKSGAKGSTHPKCSPVLNKTSLRAGSTA